MGTVSWSWKRQKDEKLFGSRAEESNSDYESEKSAKAAVERYFSSQECEKCGRTDMGGSNILVEIAKVDLHRTVAKKGFFGGEKNVDEHWKTVHRVGHVIYPTAHIFSGGGHLKCKCGHRMGSPGFFGQWAANVARGG